MPAVVGAIGAAISAVGSVVASVASTVVSAVASAVSAIGSIVSTVASAVAGAIKSIASLVWTGIKTSVSAIAKAISWGVEKIGGKLLGTFATVAQKLSSALVSFAKDIGELVWKGSAGMRAAITAVANALRDSVKAILAIIKAFGEGIFKTIRELAKWFGDAIKSVYNYVKNAINGVYDWIKKNILPKFKPIIDAINYVVDWIRTKGKQLWEWYVKNIKPYADLVKAIIHKAKVISQMISDLKKGHVLKAILEGIGIVGGEVKKICDEILKYYDGTLKGFAKGVGAAIGYVKRIITDLYETTKQVAEDVKEIALNLNVKELKRVGKFLEDISKTVLGKALVRVRGVDKTIRDWIAYLTTPTAQALAIINETYRDFRKYEHLIRAARLREFNALTPRTWIPLLYPPIITRE